MLFSLILAYIFMCWRSSAKEQVYFSLYDHCQNDACLICAFLQSQHQRSSDHHHHAAIDTQCTFGAYTFDANNMENNPIIIELVQRASKRYNNGGPIDPLSRVI
mmetsp:Transcript_30257/g.49282  ORF Transcript_30257/g.49282 Transcript_30257/m.49282 type:complete len:104 (-) Transcript_30257:9-320(-)